MNSNFFITDISLVYNEEKHKFDIGAFYDFKSGKSNQGLFHCSMEDGSDTVSHPVFSKFNDELIGKVIGAKALEKGEEMENFKFRRLVPRSDGGMLLIAEKFFISQQFETFYFNGIPQTSSKNIYNYDDLLILSMDSIGQLEWGHAEYKKQNAFSQGAYYLSVGVYAFEDHVYLIYNDNLSQNNRVLMLTLSRDGVLKQNIILKSEEEPTFVVPFEGRQVGYNAFVLPVAPVLLNPPFASILHTSGAPILNIIGAVLLVPMLIPLAVLDCILAVPAIALPDVVNEALYRLKSNPIPPLV